MKTRNVMVGLLMLILSIGMTSASGVTTNRLNWFTSEQHSVTITNTGGTTQNGISTMPAGFSFVSSPSGCTNPSGQIINCSSITSGGSKTFIMSSPVSGTEYSLSVMPTILGVTSLNNVSFINIRNDEVFHTLVEYGRGRGNYFYDSMGTATSAGTGVGYRFVPNGTAFELNYLHKIFNIKQYYGLSTADATDVSFTCDYPVHTVVRQHLTESIVKGLSEWTVSYAIPRIDGSFERMGFLGMDIDAGEYSVGDNMTINCTGIDYNLADAYGHVVVDEDSFYLQIRDPEPIGMTASASPTTIGNGTSEVEITYTFTNNELYPIDGVIMEIDAPPLAQFIGVRGELWGAAKDKYAYELTQMTPGQSEQIVLVARFDTSASADTALELTQGVKIKFVPTWEINAYNPMEYIQTLTPATTLTVNYGLVSAISSVQTQLTTIQNTVTNIQSTVNNINSTVNDIYDLAVYINSSMLTLETADQDILNAINNSRDDILAALNTSETNIINNLTQQIINNIGNLSLNTTNIMNELEYMQGFNEELVFLVTDSVGLADSAKTDVKEGDFASATDKLSKAQKNLDIVNMEMDDYMKPIENKYKIQNEPNVFKKFGLWVQGWFM
jgi:hypothetical protein